MSSVAAAATAVSQAQVANSVAVWAIKEANAQQQSVLSLLDGAMQAAEQIAAHPAAGHSVDTYA